MCMSNAGVVLRKVIDKDRHRVHSTMLGSVTMLVILVLKF